MPLSDSDCAATYKIMILGRRFCWKIFATEVLDWEGVPGKCFNNSRDLHVGKSTKSDRGTLQTQSGGRATDFVRKKLEVDGALVELQIWDTAGQERFHSMNKWQYRGVKGVALVYDITDRKSFTNLNYWLNSINNDISSPGNKYETVPVVLLGNKCDLYTDRKVQIQEGKKLAEKELAFDFFETSARTGENVFNVFRKLAFHVTEICNPEIMKSYHPNMIKETQMPAAPETRTIKCCNIVIVQWTKRKHKPSTGKRSKRKTKKTENPNTETATGNSKCCCIL